MGQGLQPARSVLALCGVQLRRGAPGITSHPGPVRETDCLCQGWHGSGSIKYSAGGGASNPPREPAVSLLYPSQALQTMPQFHGIEVDMLNLEDADCILVTGWNFGVVQRILIDGGNRCNAPMVKAFLARRRI